VGSRYDSLLFANTMKMLGTTDEKLKNHLIFRLCHSIPSVSWIAVVAYSIGLLRSLSPKPRSQPVSVTPQL